MKWEMKRMNLQISCPLFAVCEPIPWETVVTNRKKIKRFQNYIYMRA
jgi:hypothetical protein